MPAGQYLHCVIKYKPTSSPNLPRGQLVQVAALTNLVVAPNVPLLHFLQLVRPVSSLYSDIVQFKQDVSSVAPIILLGMYFPLAQSVQSLTLGDPFNMLYLPGTQEIQESDVCDDMFFHFPWTQAVHNGLPVSEIHQPAGQFLQSMIDARPTWSAYKPATHFLHIPLPPW
jgi:hypothetical protein